jgi:hypothetical protein
LRAPILRRFTLMGVLLLAGVQAAGCGKSAAIGEVDTLVVLTASDSLWNRLEDTTRSALERTLQTVRPEQTFFVEQADTASAKVGQLLLFRQIIVFGTPDNRLVKRIADAAGSEPTPATLIQARDVWARGQVATAVVLSPGDEAATWMARIPELDSLVDAEYRAFVHERMYLTGEDTATEARLLQTMGFRIQFPRVFRVDTLTDSTVVIRNDNPDPSELIRSVLVTWRPSVDSLTGAAAYAWREAVDSVYYHVPQAIDTSNGRVRRLQQDGRPALEATGAWSDEGTGYPAGGPFIDRLVQCPGRTYFLDGWVYAPGKSKYQYVIQVRDILDSFSCGGGG